VNIFEQTPGELTDREIELAMAEVCAGRDAAAGAGESLRAHQLAAVLEVLAVERDSRRHLAAAVDAIDFVGVAVVLVERPGED